MNRYLLLFLWVLPGFAAAVTSLPAAMAPRDRNGDSDHVIVDILALFEPAFPKQWGLGGVPISFESKGDYYAPFVCAEHDPQRQNVGRVCFPATKSTGSRKLVFLVGGNPGASRISFFAKWVAGEQSVNFSVYSERKKRHYTRRLSLPAQWEKITVLLADLVCEEAPGDRVDNAAIGVMEFTATNNKTIFLIDDLLLEARREPDRSISLLRPRGAPWCFLEGHKGDSLLYILSATQADSVRLFIEVREHLGWQRDTSFLLPVTKGLSALSFPLWAKGPGYYRMALTARNLSTGATVAEVRDCFVVRPRPPSGVRSPVGVNLSPLLYTPGHLESLARASIRRVRVWDFQWPDMEPLPGMRTFTSLDSLAGWARRAGIELMPVTGYAPSWKISPPTDVSPPWRALDLVMRASDDIETWRLRFGELASRYKEPITQWEFWNEPDWGKGPGYGFWGKPDLYFGLLRATNSELRKKAPQSILISGGISKNPATCDMQFVDKLIGKGYGNDFGAFGFHAYLDKNHSRQMIAKIRKHNPSAPVWMTEVGMQFDGDHAHQLREYLLKVSEYTFDFLELNMACWSMLYVHPAMRPGFRDFALVHENGSPMSRLAAICTMADMVAGSSGFKVDSISLPGLSMCTFMNSRGHCIAVWGGGRFRVTGKGAAVRRVEPLGEERTVPLADGKAEIVLPAEGLVYLISKQPIAVKTME